MYELNMYQFQWTIYILWNSQNVIEHYMSVNTCLKIITSIVCLIKPVRQELRLHIAQNAHNSKIHKCYWCIVWLE